MALALYCMLYCVYVCVCVWLEISLNICWYVSNAAVGLDYALLQQNFYYMRKRRRRSRRRNKVRDDAKMIRQLVAGGGGGAAGGEGMGYPMNAMQLTTENHLKTASPKKLHTLAVSYYLSSPYPPGEMQMSMRMWRVFDKVNALRSFLYPPPNLPPSSSLAATKHEVSDVLLQHTPFAFPWLCAWINSLPLSLSLCGSITLGVLNLCFSCFCCCCCCHLIPFFNKI